MSILVPRFYNTNIVYDDIPANSILTLDSNSYSSITLQDGILAKSNSTVGFTKPTGLLYGSMNNDVWTLNSIDPPTTGINAADKTLYYSNGKYVWSELSVSSKNIKVDPPNINGKWTNFLINENNNFTKTATDKIYDYGIFTKTGSVVNLNNKVFNELGFKFFSPSELNEIGYVATNLILYNSSASSVEFPVSYYSIVNFHSITNIEGNELSPDIQNLVYTKGLYNYTPAVNDLPIDINNTLLNTYHGFYSYNNTNTTFDTTNMYIHYTTTIDVDSIVLPPSNSNYWTVIKVAGEDVRNNYILENLSDYLLVVGVSTNFSSVGEKNTKYSNIFLANQYTPVKSNDNTDTLLGYIIIDLSNIDSNGKVNINKSFNIDSTIPYNSGSISKNEQLKNGIISFRPYYYINRSNDIRSLHYDDYVNKPLIQNIKKIEPHQITFNGDVTLSYGSDYIYSNDKLRLLGNTCVDSNFQNIYAESQMIIPSYAIKTFTIDTTHNIETITVDDSYCDTKNGNLYFLGNNYIKAFRYLRNNTNAVSDITVGYSHYNNNLIYTCFRTTNDVQDTTVILSSNKYSFNAKDKTLTDKNNTGNFIILDIDINSTQVWTNGSIIIDDPYRNFKPDGGNLRYKDTNFTIVRGYYEVYNPRILNSSIIYISPTNSNIHVFYQFKLEETQNQYYVDNYRVTFPDYNIQYVLYKSYNNIFLTEGDIKMDGYNSSSYTSIRLVYDGTKINGMYENRPFLFNTDYISNSELLIDNSDNRFQKTVYGITYRDNNGELSTVFNADDASFNLLNQLSVNTSKYYYDQTTKSIYDNMNTLILSNIDGVSYKEYIEITNSTYGYITNNIQTTTGIIQCNFLFHSLNSLTSLHINSLKNGIIIIKNYPNKKGDNVYTNDQTLVELGNMWNIFPTTNYDIIPTKNSNMTFTKNASQITLTLTSLNNISYNNKITVGNQGIYKSTKYILHYDGNSYDIVYADDYTDFPFFDIPVEKDIKIILNPITKYTNLKYYTATKTANAYTFATHIDFKISLCNINAILTSYVGEYPSIIETTQ